MVPQATPMKYATLEHGGAEFSVIGGMILARATEGESRKLLRPPRF
jgi:hypothetical protein